MVKKVWVWLGEGPTLQNTQIFCDVDRGDGDRRRGMAGGYVTHHAAMDLGHPREEEGQRMAGAGASLEDTSEVRFAHRCPTSALGNLEHYTRQAFSFRQVTQTESQNRYLILPGIKDESVVFANCPLNSNQQHQWSLQGRRIQVMWFPGHQRYWAIWIC